LLEQVCFYIAPKIEAVKTSSHNENIGKA
jgi:hypothetical protein